MVLWLALSLNLTGCVQQVPGVQVSVSFMGQSAASAQNLVRSMTLQKAEVSLTDIQLLPCPEETGLAVLLRWASPIGIARAHHASIHGEGPRNLGRFNGIMALDLLEVRENELGTKPALAGRWCGLVVQIGGAGSPISVEFQGTMRPRAGMESRSFGWQVTEAFSVSLATSPFTTSEAGLVALSLNGDLESAFELLEGLTEPTNEELQAAVSRSLRLTVRAADD